MGLSNVMWGYVAARGRPSVSDRTDSGYNRRAICQIERFAQLIDNLPKQLVERRLLGYRESGSYLRGIVLDVDLKARAGMSFILKEMEFLGTLVVPNLDHLKAPTLNEADIALHRYVKTKSIAVLCLDNDLFPGLLRKGISSIGDADLMAMANHGVETRSYMIQRLDGIERLPKRPLRQLSDHMATGRYTFIQYRDGQSCGETKLRESFWSDIVS